MQPNLIKNRLERVPIALDYQATTPCSKEVLEAMAPYWNKEWGNPSSRQHSHGLRASAAVNLAREELASCLKITPDRIIFTSGATEANNLALLGHARAIAKDRKTTCHLITVSTEHLAVLDPLRQLNHEGFELTEIRPNKDGLINTGKLVEAFRKNTILVSIMVANNEIGVIQPIQEIAKLCQDKGITFHSDAAQALGNISLSPDKLNLDLMSISGHKIYGPKGIGALIKRPGIPLIPLQYGGGQEQGFRAGTLPVPLIIGLAKASKIAVETLKDNERKSKNLRDKLLTELKSLLPDISINGSLEHRLPNNLNITVPGVKGINLHRELRKVISCSTGSACSHGSPSHVLKALGLSPKEASASLRLSIGRETTKEEIKIAGENIARVVNHLRVQ